MISQDHGKLADKLSTSIPMSVDDKPTFARAHRDHPLYGLVGPLVAIHRGREERMHGTAFLIAPGLAVTAAHVVIDYLEAFQKFNLSHGKGDHRGQLSFNMVIPLLRADGTHCPLRVIHISFSLPGDFAILHLDRPKDGDWSSLTPFPTLQLGPPNEQSHIQAFGFPSGKVTKGADGIANLHTWPRLSVGSVLEIHDRKRDGVTLNFPCFRTNARFDGGMSGAPIINNAGNVCGMVCKSYDLLADEEPISYGATLWPIAGIKLAHVPPIGRDNCRVGDLLVSRQIASVDYMRLTGGIDASGRFFVGFEPSNGNEALLPKPGS